MKMNKLVKSSVATSMALLLLSGTANAEGKITPVSVKKVDDKVTLYKTTATADSDKFKISQILTFNFIKDKSYDKDTLVPVAVVLYKVTLSSTFLTLTGVILPSAFAVLESNNNAIDVATDDVKYEVNWKTHEIKVKGQN
jgi:hypothetical protein